VTRIAVVDYGAGNLVSIDQALRAAGAEVVIARRGVDVRGAAGLIVPGVGAAGPAMTRLLRRDLVAPIRDWVAADRPFLGICLGMQLLFEESGEDGARTLGILPGHTLRLVGAPRLPHIGWNAVRRRRDHPLFDGIAPDALFYFVHSFAPQPAGPEAQAITLAVTDHGQDFVSAVARGRLAGVQFHPERSGRDGLRLLAAFVALATDSRATGEPLATPGGLPAIPGTPAGPAPAATTVRAPGSAA
jgi:imidazole glycerol phosphate synthase glutamine amidotransferase subunit